MESGGQTAHSVAGRHSPFSAQALNGRLADGSQFGRRLGVSTQAPLVGRQCHERNRTICGLVHAMIVIEAGTTGGTWAAGQAALELGVPLFVLDFPNPAPSGEGNPLLLKKGGRPLPCRPGEPPDLSLLVQALDLPRPRVFRFYLILTTFTTKKIHPHRTFKAKQPHNRHFPDLSPLQRSVGPDQVLSPRQRSSRRTVTLPPSPDLRYPLRSLG